MSDEINDELFNLWERGMSCGAVAMINEMEKLGVINTQMAELFADALQNDLIVLKVDNDVQRGQVDKTQRKIDSLYMEKIGKEGRG